MNAAEQHISHRAEYQEQAWLSWQARGKSTSAVMEQSVKDAAGIRFEIRHDIGKWTRQLSNTPDELMAWVSGELADQGMIAASGDVNRRNLGEYACWVARNYLQDTCFGISAELQGDNELNYWRAIAIATNYYQGTMD